MKQRSPWGWIPTLYTAEGIPYVIVMSVATVMYERMGLTNAQIALYTSISPVITDQDANKSGDIYTMTGVKVRKNATSTAGLPQGIYIFKGKKIVVK